MGKYAWINMILGGGVFIVGACIGNGIGDQTNVITAIDKCALSISCIMVGIWNMEIGFRNLRE